MRLPRLPKEYTFQGQPSNYTFLPEGSIKRAQAFAIELQVQFGVFAVNVSLWHTMEEIALREKPWKILGDDEETFFRKVVGKTRSEIRQGAIQAERAQALAAKVGAVAEHGEIGRNHLRDDKNKNVMSEQDYGNSSAYRIAKLKRDHPEIAKQLAEGRFRNVREAERAAGVSVPLKLSPVEKVLRAFHRLTLAEQKDLLRRIVS